MVGYVSDRHVLVLVLCGIFLVAGGVFALSELVTRFAHRLRARATPASQATAVTSGRLAVVLLVALMGFGLQEALKPLHGNRAGHRQAGLWLAEHTRLADPVIDPFCWRTTTPAESSGKVSRRRHRLVTWPRSMWSWKEVPPASIGACRRFIRRKLSPRTASWSTIGQSKKPKPKRRFSFTRCRPNPATAPALSLLKASRVASKSATLPPPVPCRSAARPSGETSAPPRRRSSDCGVAARKLDFAHQLSAVGQCYGQRGWGCRRIAAAQGSIAVNLDLGHQVQQSGIA